VLLSDHDIKLELDAGRIGLDPYDSSLIQPSSIDVRLDRLFRLFDNHKYPFIDPGFTGHVTLELSNVATLPIKLWPGMKIGQLCFFRLSSPADHPYGSGEYGSRYQGQRGPTASRSARNFVHTDVSARD
jgi:deoxycytidine triphosphate deaminase